MRVCVRTHTEFHSKLEIFYLGKKSDLLNKKVTKTYVTHKYYVGKPSGKSALRRQVGEGK